jgi:hypothetical protein
LRLKRFFKKKRAHVCKISRRRKVSVIRENEREKIDKAISI